MKKIKVQLSYDLARQLLSICNEAADMHQNFLMHDDWETDMAPKDRRRVKRTRARYLYAFANLRVRMAVATVDAIKSKKAGKAHPSRPKIKHT